MGEAMEAAELFGREYKNNRRSSVDEWSLRVGCCFDMVSDNAPASTCVYHSSLNYMTTLLREISTPVTPQRFNCRSTLFDHPASTYPRNSQTQGTMLALALPSNESLCTLSSTPISPYLERMYLKKRQQNGVDKICDTPFPEHRCYTIEESETETSNQGHFNDPASGSLQENNTLKLANQDTIEDLSKSLSERNLDTSLLEVIGEDQHVSLEDEDMFSINSDVFDLHQGNVRPSDTLPSRSLDFLTFDDLQLDFEPSLFLNKLTNFMVSSRESQEMLQEWDVKNGLPRSHSWTMMHTNRSRRQLLEGKILPKWNGVPLISGGKIKRKNATEDKKMPYKSRKGCTKSTTYGHNHTVGL